MFLTKLKLKRTYNVTIEFVSEDYVNFVASEPVVHRIAAQN